MERKRRITGSFTVIFALALSLVQPFLVRSFVRKNFCWEQRRATPFRLYQTGSKDVVLDAAKEALDHLARRGKSWKRLRHLVYLAVSNPPTRTVADVGTDHGLLAMAFAVTGKYERVFGVDVSTRALQNGAWKLHQQFTAQTTTNATTLPVDFFESDGLSNLRRGQADTVCIAGMGVHTIVEILTKRNSTSQQLLLDELNCQRLVLQPTNSKPQHLIRLYDTLRDMGWGAQDERIEYLSSRWYLSSIFERTDERANFFPGTLLSATSDNEMRKVYLDWVYHHQKWILLDLKKRNSCSADQRELRPLAAFDEVMSSIADNRTGKYVIQTQDHKSFDIN